MAKFDLGDFAKTLQNVPDSGTTGPERIEYIPLSDLHEDERNFYALTGIDELAANIQLCGLMDPLRVRKTEDGYTIVSGHRRFAALRLLAAEDDKFGTAACIIEAGDTPAALQELRLIYANSDTRKMSSADIGKQAERVEALLYELKEQGMEFPGRMRDHVAEACKISKSKLSRLKVIRDRLAPDIRKAYWDGSEKKQLRESTAYELAQLPVDVQRMAVDAYRKSYYGSSDNGLKYMPSKIASNATDLLKDLSKKRCSRSNGGDCINKARILAHALNVWGKSIYSHVACGRICCAECGSFVSCRDACSELGDLQKAMKAEAKEKNRQAKEAEAERQRPDVDEIKAIWARFGSLRARAGLSPDDYKNRIECPYMGVLPEEFESLEAGTAKVTPGTDLPFGYHVNLDNIHRWQAAAKALNCSVDYLMMLTDEPRPVSDLVKGLPEPGQLTLGCWMPGGTNPAHPCNCIVIMDLDSPESPGKSVRQQAYWQRGEFWFSKTSSNKIDLPILAWLEIPEWKGRTNNED